MARRRTYKPHDRKRLTVPELYAIVSHQFFDGEPVEIQHDPPLAMREGVSIYSGVQPNDPRYCYFMKKADHREVTANKDIKMVAKNNRQRQKHREHLARIEARQCGDKRQPTGSIRSRGFPKNQQAIPVRK